MHMEEFILQMCFHLQLFALTLFRNLAFPSLITYAVLQNVHKNRVMETKLMSQVWLWDDREITHRRQVGVAV